MKNAEINDVVVKNLNLSHLTKPQQDKIVSIIVDSVSARINIALWERLSYEHKDELQKAIKQGSEKLLEYINSHVENFPGLVEDITRKTISDFKQKRAKLAA